MVPRFHIHPIHSANCLRAIFVQNTNLRNSEKKLFAGEKICGWLTMTTECLNSASLSRLVDLERETSNFKAAVLNRTSKQQLELSK